MRVVRTALLLGVLIMPAVARAQRPGITQPDLVSPVASTFNDLACAPFLIYAPPNDRLRISGSQDTTVKQMMGPGDTLVVNAGLDRGLQVGQEFFVRRVTRSFGARGPDPDHPLSVHTAAWIKLAGVGPTFSTASITHACDGILLNDYLEPFVPPVVAATHIDGAPRLAHLGRIMVADEGKWTAGIGEIITIDRGSNHGVVNGQRFSVFRDNHGAAGPLVEVGTVVTVSVRPESSTVRILEARDAIMRDDRIAIRR